jgi:hypothetical protein
MSKRSFFACAAMAAFATCVLAATALQPAPVDTSALSGTHKNEMPLNLEVVGFGE